MELDEYLAAYQNYWSDNLSKLLAIKASETITVDAALLRFIAELDETTYLQLLDRLKQLLETASPISTAILDSPAHYRTVNAEYLVDPGQKNGVAMSELPERIAA